MKKTLIFSKIVIIKNNAVANCKRRIDVIVNANREFRKKLYDCKICFKLHLIVIAVQMFAFT